MTTVALLSGGVGGARLARGLAATLDPDALTVIVNVGDDETVYGSHVSADLDTVAYTLAGIEGSEGWGIAGDTFTVMDHLADLGISTTFRLGDRDLATCLLRSAGLAEGKPLSEVTQRITTALGIDHLVLPATDDRLRTLLETPDGVLGFQDYFVIRGQRDPVTAVMFEGADEAVAAPGVAGAIANADMVVIAPSNPPLSIWPMLAIAGVRAAVAAAPRVVAVSPLFGGKALKGPADRVMASLGLPAGTLGVLAAYRGLVHDLVVDDADPADADVDGAGVRIHALDTRIADPDRARRFAERLLAL